MNEAATPVILIVLGCIVLMLLSIGFGLSSQIDDCKCHCQENK